MDTTDTKDIKIDFTTFVMSLASAAYCSLGLIPNPITNKIDKNLIAAKQQIDLIEMLKDKTKGNLEKNEEQMLESILYQLHLSYVKVSEITAAPGETNTETKPEGGIKNEGENKEGGKN